MGATIYWALYGEPDPLNWGLTFNTDSTVCRDKTTVIINTDSIVRADKTPFIINTDSKVQWQVLIYSPMRFSPVLRSLCTVARTPLGKES